MTADLIENPSEPAACDCRFYKHEDNGQALPPPSGDFIHLLLIATGSAVVTVNGQPTTAQGPCVVHFLPGQDRSWQVAPGSTVHVLSLVMSCLDETALEILQARTEDGNRQIFNEPADTADMLALAGMLARHVEPGRPLDETALMLAKTIGQILVRAERKQKKPVKKPNIAAKKLAARLSDLLYLHFRTVKTPAMYASMLGVQVSHLDRMMRTATGLSTMQVIIRHEVREAKRLLIHTDLTVNDIARTIGYHDAGIFNRIFSKSEGITPLRFRKQFARN